MATSLLQLMDELLQNIEQRDAGDPDAPAWEACARIERIEQELARRLNAGESMDLTIRLNPVAGAGTMNRAVIGTERGVTIETYFSGP